MPLYCTTPRHMRFVLPETCQAARYVIRRNLPERRRCCSQLQLDALRFTRVVGNRLASRAHWNHDRDLGHSHTDHTMVECQSDLQSPFVQYVACRSPLLYPWRLRTPPNAPPKLLESHPHTQSCQCPFNPIPNLHNATLVKTLRAVFKS